MNEFYLTAEFDSKIYSTEIELNGISDMQDAINEAAKGLKANNADVELIAVHAYASDPDLQVLADAYNWLDLFLDSEMTVIEDFLALDEDDQVKVLYLHGWYSTYSLEQIIEELNNVTVTIYEDKNEMVFEWAELFEVPERIIFYIDDDLVLRDYYRSKERLQSGNWIVVHE